MPWLQLRMILDTSEVEVAEERLRECGAEAVTLVDAGDEALLEPAPGALPLWKKTVLMALFPQHADLAVVRSYLTDAGFSEATFQGSALIEDRVWERAWMDHFAPMRFGRRLWIVPSHAPVPEQADAVSVQLDPGLAFGTGTHPSTALCLEYLDSDPPAGKSVLDYGCGSGVLALAALKLGARRVYALDHDPQALTAAQENLRRNFGENDALVLLQPGERPAEPVDLLFANILASTLIELAPELRRLVKRAGRIVLSGILAEQAQSVIGAYGWSGVEQRNKDGWTMLCSSP